MPVRNFEPNSKDRLKRRGVVTFSANGDMGGYHIGSYRDIPNAWIQPSSQPVSTCRLTPLTPWLRSRNTVASTTSSIRDSCPVGVRATTWLRSRSRQNGLSPTMPGWMALTLTGASSVASVCTRLEMPPFTVDTVVEPGVGPLFGQAAEQHDRAARVDPGPQRMHDLGVPDQLERDQPQRPVDVVVGHGVDVTLDRGQDQAVHRVDPGHGGGDGVRLGQVEGQAGGVAADWMATAADRSASRPVSVTRMAGLRVVPGDFQTDAGGAADDHDAAHGLIVPQVLAVIGEAVGMAGGRLRAWV